MNTVDFELFLPDDIEKLKIENQLYALAFPVYKTKAGESCNASMVRYAKNKWWINGVEYYDEPFIVENLRAYSYIEEPERLSEKTENKKNVEL